MPAAPEEAKGQIGPQILVLHGEGDAWVKPEVIANFRNKLQESGDASGLAPSLSFPASFARTDVLYTSSVPD